jgi:aldehyde dehydrogenase (NAD+)
VNRLAAETAQAPTVALPDRDPDLGPIANQAQYLRVTKLIRAAMAIAREEVFGPVLSILAYDTLNQAVAIANDSPYGLSGYVWEPDEAECGAVAARLRTRMVHVNGASLDSAVPFGGYKMSGNGCEWGVYGLLEFLKVKSVFGGA